MKLGPDCQLIRETFDPEEVMEVLVNAGLFFTHSKLKTGHFLFLWYTDGRSPLSFANVSSDNREAFWKATDWLFKTALNKPRLVEVRVRFRRFLKLARNPEELDRLRRTDAEVQFERLARNQIRKTVKNKKAPTHQGIFVESILSEVGPGFAHLLTHQRAKELLLRILDEEGVTFPEVQHTPSDTAAISEFGEGNPNPGWVGGEDSYKASMRSGNADYFSRRNEDYQ